MKKLFISQPMNGKSDEDILTERHEAIRQTQLFLGEELEVLDTLFNDLAPTTKPLEYLALSIAYLAKADIVYFAEGWRAARGCRIEHRCAVEYGIDRIEGIYKS